MKLLGIAAFFTAMTLSAQTNSDSAAIQALLTEVRQLRMVVEKSLGLAPRMQLLLQRAQFQEQKVGRLTQQLDEVRKEIGAEASRQANANERLMKIEQEIASETDPEHHKQLEDMRRGLKMVAGAAPDQQLRARESEVTNALQTEQAVLDDINNRLDAIDQQLPR